MSGPLDALLASENATQHRRVRRACGLAAVFGVASVALLGTSGWFITAAAAAGVAGIAAAQAFNYMLPSAAIRLLAIARTGARYGERLLAHEAALLALARVRPRLFQALARAAPERALAVTTGEATSALIQDVGVIEGRLMRRTAPWAAGAAVATGLAGVACASWPAAASTALCAAVILGSAAWLSARLRARAIATREAGGAMKEELALMAGAETELRCLGLGPWALQRLDRRIEALANAQRADASAASRFELLLTGAPGVAGCLAILLSRGAGAPLAALAALAAAMTLEGAGTLVRHLSSHSAVMEAERRLDVLLSLDEAGLSIDTPDLTDVGDLVDTGALIEAPCQRPAVDLSWPIRTHLPAGSRVAIVGPSGCGKTSLVEALIGLRAAAPGTLFVAGRDITTLPPARLRECFAWVPQDAALLSGSVRDNLALAGPAIDELSMWRALREAAVDDRVRALPESLDTWIGEDGMRLSGGERRRIALARALLCDAPWLLLDEPTEGLDSENEARIVQRLRARSERTGQGLIVITHRPKLLECCDVVLRVGRGQAVGRPSKSDQHRKLGLLRLGPAPGRSTRAATSPQAMTVVTGSTTAASMSWASLARDPDDIAAVDGMKPSCVGVRARHGPVGAPARGDGASPWPGRQCRPASWPRNPVRVPTG